MAAPCRIPKINIRPTVRALISSTDRNLISIARAAMQLNDIVDALRDILCQGDVAPTTGLFDKATFGINGDASVSDFTTISVPGTTLPYTTGPLTWRPLYATADASQSPPSGADLIIDIKYLPPDLDPTEYPFAITAVIYGSPVQLQIPAHPFADNDRTRIEGTVPGIPAGSEFPVTVIDPNNIFLQGSSVMTGAYVSGGLAIRTNWATIFGSKKLVVPDASNDGTIVWPDCPPSKAIAEQRTFISNPSPSLVKKGRLRVDILQVGSTTPGGNVEINLYLLQSEVEETVDQILSESIAPAVTEIV